MPRTKYGTNYMYVWEARKQYALHTAEETKHCTALLSHMSPWPFSQSFLHKSLLILKKIYSFTTLSRILSWLMLFITPIKNVNTEYMLPIPMTILDLHWRLLCGQYVCECDKLSELGHVYPQENKLCTHYHTVQIELPHVDAQIFIYKCLWVVILHDFGTGTIGGLCHALWVYKNSNMNRQIGVMVVNDAFPLHTLQVSLDTLPSSTTYKEG